MKRSLLLSVAFLMFPLISGAQQAKNAIHDPFFARGFNVVCPDPAVDTLCGVLLVDSTATPVWTVRQYNSKFNIVNNRFENIGNRYNFRVSGNGNMLAKSLSVNPVKGALTMECNASAEYKGIRRLDQPWVSMTADAPTDTISLSNCQGLRLSLAYRVLSYEDCMGFLADKEIHSATYRIAFLLRNVNRESLSYGKQFRLGLVLFDNRYMGAPCHANLERSSSPHSGEFTYYPKSAMYIHNAKLPKVKQIVEFNVDLLPIVKEALGAAVADNLLPDTVEGDWEIVSCDMGWEMKGTYNASIQVKKLHLTAH
ncbi:MAG: hypothetical protein IKN31_02005 [Bacteroidales bacterium]|nr:hypothetical protein [Bacteroidales bacterium]